MVAKYKIKKGFIVQRMKDKVVIFDSERSLLYTFNETASFIFKKLKLGWDKEEIMEDLVKKYKTKTENVRGDVEDLISVLLTEKIITKER